MKPNETTHSVDLPRLRQDLRQLTARSCQLKRHLRQRWAAPMSAVQRELDLVRRRTTERLVLLAWTRGRFHVTVKPRRGAVPETDEVYVQQPGTGLLRLVRWSREEYRRLIVLALLPEYPAGDGAAPVNTLLPGVSP